MTTPIPERVTVRLFPEDTTALDKIAQTIATPHRRAPTMSEAMRAAIQAAVTTIALSGVLPG